MLHKNISILLMMISIHVIYEFHFQTSSIVRRFKISTERIKNKYDYIMSLCLHGICWAYIMMVPYLVGRKMIMTDYDFIFFSTNAFVHTVVDNIRYNMNKLTFTKVQMIYVSQIILLWVCLQCEC